MTLAEPQMWGPRLYAHLDAHWGATGSNQTAWCLDHKIQASTVSRWGTGAQPTLAAMQIVADALGISLLDVLLIAGVVDAREVRREAPQAATISPPEVAIANDPTLNDLQKEHALNYIASLRDIVERTRAERARPRGRKAR